VANTLDSFRNGAVGFIDWLDGLASQPPSAERKGQIVCGSLRKLGEVPQMRPITIKPADLITTIRLLDERGWSVSFVVGVLQEASRILRVSPKMRHEVVRRVCEQWLKLCEAACLWLTAGGEIVEREHHLTRKK
jgi:hypothetical protein